MPGFSLVGLPDPAVRESRERVRAALVNAGFEFPLRRITVNLAPADFRKAGPAFDLAIAAALLAASGQLPSGVLEATALAGELALDGAIRTVYGVLPMVEAAAGRALRSIVIPAANGREAALAATLAMNGRGAAEPELRIVPMERLEQLTRLGTTEEPSVPAPPADASEFPELPDLSDLRGQPYLRRALEVAAAGGHGLLIVGPPGSGKSLAARRLPSLLPPLSGGEALEVMRIASACGRLRADEAVAVRPFRAPHHTISPAGLVGGGNPPRAGEITLAHRGVLFLDELGEFDRPALEALRQPLEDGRVMIARARHVIELPCRFQLVAAANPCPCGRGPESDGCSCPPQSVSRYEGRLSGALADRIDITLAVGQPSAGALAGDPGEASAVVSDRVAEARARAAKRLGPGRCNADMTAAESRRHAALDREAEAVLADGHTRLGLSGRGYERVLRVARTVADLGASERVTAAHVGEALALRRRSGEEA
jgi:magnesium chelatase family protein